MEDLVKILGKTHWLRAFSTLSGNLSAGWLGLAFVTPNFADLTKLEALFVLIRDVIFGIIFLIINAKLEKQISNE